MAKPVAWYCRNFFSGTELKIRKALKVLSQGRTCTAAWFGVVPAALISGAGSIAVVLLWMRLFPALASRDKLIRDDS